MSKNNIAKRNTLKKRHPMHRACYNKDIKKVKEILKDKKFNINVRDADNFTPLMNACHKGSLDIVKLLLKHPKVKINARSKNGKTPLFFAAAAGHSKVVKYLINQGANPNIKEKKNRKCTRRKPFDIAQICSRKKIMTILNNKKN